LVICLPCAFALHVSEEAPTFVEWFNSLVARHITQQLFLLVNAVAFGITCCVAFLLVAARDKVSGLIGVAWVGFLMLANGLFHLVGTVVHWRYSPGVVTGTLVYLPLSVLFIRAVVIECRVSPAAALLVALVGGIPMYVHGFLIVFRGNRLF
jgi:hypothetical protein